MEFSSVIFGFLPNILYLVAWIIAVFFAVKMVRHKEGRAERFLLVGASLMLVNSMVTSTAAALRPWLVVWLAQIENTPGPASIPPLFLAIEALRGCIFLAGIVCLVYAFWIKFKARTISGGG